MDLNEKYRELQRSLLALGRVLVAYSGGVDSTFLLKAAVDALGQDHVLGVIGVSASLSEAQHQQAVTLAKAIGAQVVDVAVDELEDRQYRANQADRCFHCKSLLYTRLRQTARERGFEHVVCGANADDASDYRPGHHAALNLGVTSPLMEAGWTKQAIRAMSRLLGLATADLPASPCLASRIAYGLEVTEQRLGQVEQAEAVLRGLGLKEFRVRHHGPVARIEVPVDLLPALTQDPMRTRIVDGLKAAGFRFIAMDMQGLRSGSLNEMIGRKGTASGPG